MAKKKTEDNISLNSAAEQLRAEINAKYKLDICTSAQTILDRVIKVVPWSPSFDLILSGGIPTGTWISFSGPEKCGKTTASLHLAAKAQQIHKMPIYFLPVEGRFKKMNLTSIAGLDLSDDMFTVIESKATKSLATQDYCEITEMILKSRPGSMIIIDSVSALHDQREMDGGLGTATRGNNQKVLTQFINNVQTLVSSTNSIVLGILHYYSNTSGYGAAKLEKAASRWLYQADVQLRVKGVKLWGKTETSPPFGQIMDVECKTSALGSPYRRTESYIRYGKGIDDTFELLQQALSCGLINKGGGGWYTLNFNNKEEKVQGDDAACQFFNERPELFKQLSEETKRFADSLASCGGD